MIKHLCTLIASMMIVTLTTTSLPSFANTFNPAVLAKSTVRILIKQKRTVVSAASGFVWQKDNQVVTSLHVMRGGPNVRIIVEFGKVKRLGKVVKVLPGADLVLLEVNKPVSDYVPLTSYKKQKTKYKDQVSALGFNQGALGMSTRELVKGFVDPEELRVLLPPDALASLSKSEVINTRLPIYYLDGSLLPGYSGSPVVDDKGQLIGIGDGGLENGAASVSWVIPAHNLDDLDKSTITALPASLALVNQAFKSDTLGFLSDRYIKPANSLLAWLYNHIRFAFTDRANNEEDPLYVNPNDIPPLISVSYDKFEFVKVKQRSYQQLLNSSDDPAKINKAFELFQLFFYDYKIDHQRFKFDVYEDSRYGLNIAVPAGNKLTVADDKYLLVEGEMFCRTCPYEIQYHARQFSAKQQKAVNQDGEQFLTEVANTHWSDLNLEGEYGEFEDFRHIDAYGANRFVLRSAFSDMEEAFKDKYELNYFIAATNKDAWFQAQGILNRFDDAFFELVEKHRGSDCSAVNSNNNIQALCVDINTMLKILISVHLTSFSNKFFLKASEQ